MGDSGNPDGGAGMTEASERLQFEHKDSEVPLLNVVL